MLKKEGVSEMTLREVKKTVRGAHTTDGAGVHLVRVLNRNTVEAFDPFLMLDSFDSTNPSDYILGFPWHPHRGIETVTYLIDGEVLHEDSLGNKGRIGSGQSQWMTAGSGIMHQEMPQPSPRMLGLQLWLNMPKSEKMSPPRYLDITEKMIGEIHGNGSTIRVISGDFDGTRGISPHHIQATILDVALDAGKSITIPTAAEENVFVFSILGDVTIGAQEYPEKTAVLFGQGDAIEVSADANEQSRFIFFSGRPLREEVAWGGPIVMNTQEELRQAFADLESGNFIRDEATY